MSRLVNPIPRFADRHFLFYLHHETPDSQWEIVNAHQGIELVLVMEGTGQAILDGKLHKVAAGTLIICQPYQLHHYKMEPHYIRTPLVFDPYLFDQYAAAFPVLQAFFHKIWKGRLGRQIFELSEEQKRRFDSLFCGFYERIRGASEFVQQEELILLLLELFREIRKLYAEEESRDHEPGYPREGRHIEQMMAWIEEHYHEEFSLDRLADSLHLSPYYASHLFSEETGCTLSQYIMARRLRESCLLLTLTDKTISQVGKLAGFNSSAYFGKQFKKKMGVSPYTFRKQSGRG